MSPLEALMKRYDEKYPYADNFARGFYRHDALRLLADLKAAGCTVTVTGRKPEVEEPF